MGKGFIFGAVLTLFLSGCVVKKPDAYEITSPDYNQRVDVSGAHYRKRLSAVGVFAITAGTAGGGYWGYNTPILMRQDGDSREPRQYANAALGALAGFALVNTANFLMGQNQKKPVRDIDKWVRKANESYVLYDKESTGDFMVIHQTADAPDYQVRNLTDAQDFARSFPNSSNIDMVVTAGIENLSRSELLDLLELFPKTSHRLKIMKTYVISSRTVAQAVEAFQRFKGLRDLAESRAVELVTDIDDAEIFLEGFPNTTYDTAIEERIAPTLRNLEGVRRFLALFPETKQRSAMIASLHENAPRIELPEIIELFPGVEDVQILQERYVLRSSTIVELFAACRKYPTAAFGIDPTVNVHQLTAARNLYRQLKIMEDQLGYTNSVRLQKNLRETYLDHALAQALKLGRIEDLQVFIRNVRSEKWLTVGRDSYLQRANSAITEIRNTEAKQRRRSELAKARRQGMHELVRFVKRYKGTEEARSAAAEVNEFVQRNVLITDEFWWAAAGDRSWLNDFYESSRDWIGGGDQYNIFTGGILKNTSENWLTLKVNTQIHMICVKNLSLIVSRDRSTYNEYYYIELAPGEEAPFLTLFKNVSTGTRIGSSLLFSAGSNCDIDGNNPYDINFELYPGNIPVDISEQQYRLLRAASDAGNVSTNSSPMDNVNALFNTRYDDGYGDIHVYTPAGHACTVTVSNQDGQEITSKRTEDDVQFTSLRRGQTYSVNVSGIGSFSIYLDDRIEQRIIDEDGNIEVYQEVD